MSAVVKNNLLLYADNSAILVSARYKSDIENELSNNLNIVSNWLVNNKLSLHICKTVSILFGQNRE